MAGLPLPTNENGMNVFRHVRAFLALNDRVGQRANTIDRDVNDVLFCQRKGAIGNDSGSGKQKCTVNEIVIANQPLDEISNCLAIWETEVSPLKTVAPLRTIANRIPIEDRLAYLRQSDPRTETTALVIDLRLRQIEWVVAFDVAAAHVVADRCIRQSSHAETRRELIRVRARSSLHRNGFGEVRYVRCSDWVSP